MDFSALEKEIELKRKELELLEQIRDLDKKIQILRGPASPEPAPGPAPIAPVIVPYAPPAWMLCMTGNHDFPMPWYGTTLPTCRRCGAPAFSQPYIVTCTNGGIRQEPVNAEPLNLTPHAHVTSGYIAPAQEQSANSWIGRFLN